MLLANVLRRKDLKRQSLPFAALQRLAQSITLGTFQAELVQVDAGLFADLDDSEPRVEIERQVVGMHLVKGRPAAVLVR